MWLVGESSRRRPMHAPTVIGLITLLCILTSTVVTADDIPPSPPPPPPDDPAPSSVSFSLSLVLYDSLLILGRIGSCLTILSSALVVLTYLRLDTVRIEFSNRFICYMSCNDLLSSLILVIGRLDRFESFNNEVDQTWSQRVRMILLQHTLLSSILWSSCMALNHLLMVRFNRSIDSIRSLEKFEHTFVWLLTITSHIIIWQTDAFGEGLFWCWCGFGSSPYASGIALWVVYLPSLVCIIFNGVAYGVIIRHGRKVTESITKAASVGGGATTTNTAAARIEPSQSRVGVTCATPQPSPRATTIENGDSPSDIPKTKLIVITESSPESPSKLSPLPTYPSSHRPALVGVSHGVGVGVLPPIDGDTQQNRAHLAALFQAEHGATTQTNTNTQQHHTQQHQHQQQVQPLAAPLSPMLSPTPTHRVSSVTGRARPISLRQAHAQSLRTTLQHQHHHSHTLSVPARAAQLLTLALGEEDTTSGSETEIEQHQQVQSSRQRSNQPTPQGSNTPIEDETIPGDASNIASEHALPSIIVNKSCLFVPSIHVPSSSPLSSSPSIVAVDPAALVGGHSTPPSLSPFERELSAQLTTMIHTPDYCATPPMTGRNHQQQQQQQQHTPLTPRAPHIGEVRTGTSPHLPSTSPSIPFVPNKSLTPLNSCRPVDSLTLPRRLFSRLGSGAAGGVGNGDSSMRSATNLNPIHMIGLKQRYIERRLIGFWLALVFGWIPGLISTFVLFVHGTPSAPLLVCHLLSLTLSGSMNAFAYGLNSRSIWQLIPACCERRVAKIMGQMSRQQQQQQQQQPHPSTLTKREKSNQRTIIHRRRQLSLSIGMNSMMKTNPANNNNNNNPTVHPHPSNPTIISVHSNPLVDDASSIRLLTASMPLIHSSRNSVHPHATTPPASADETLRADRPIRHTNGTTNNDNNTNTNPGLASPSYASPRRLTASATLPMTMDGVQVGVATPSLGPVCLGKRSTLTGLTMVEAGVTGSTGTETPSSNSGTSSRRNSDVSLSHDSIVSLHGPPFTSPFQSYATAMGVGCGVINSLPPSPAHTHMSPLSHARSHTLRAPMSPLVCGGSLASMANSGPSSSPVSPSMYRRLQPRTAHTLGSGSSSSSSHSSGWSPLHHSILAGSGSTSSSPSPFGGHTATAAAIHVSSPSNSPTVPQSRIGSVMTIATPPSALSQLTQPQPHAPHQAHLDPSQLPVQSNSSESCSDSASPSVMPPPQAELEA